MTSLNKYTSYKQKTKASKNSPWSSPGAETGMVVARSSGVAGTIYIRPMFQLEPLLMVHQLTGLT